MLSEEEKLYMVRASTGLDEEVVPDSLVRAYLAKAKSVIQERRNPFDDDPTAVEWEHRYDHLQCQIAEDMLSRRGAEGEVTHTENGISRQYKTGGVTAELLARVVPKAKAV